jgi:hypothetical protein
MLSPKYSLSYISRFSPFGIRTTNLDWHSNLDWIFIIVFGEEKLLFILSCVFLHLPVTPCPVGSDVVLSVLFSYAPSLCSSLSVQTRGLVWHFIYSEELLTPAQFQDGGPSIVNCLLLLIQHIPGYRPFFLFYSTLYLLSDGRRVTFCWMIIL